MKRLISFGFPKIPIMQGGMAQNVLWLIIAAILITGALGDYTTNCSSLLLGQYLCLDLNIAPETQQPRGCNEKGRAKVVCQAAPGIICTETNNGTFEREIPCKWVQSASIIGTFLKSVLIIFYLYIAKPLCGSMTIWLNWYDISFSNSV